MSQQAAIDKCYAIEDNTEAFKCLKEATQQPAACRVRLVLFTQNGCGGCKEERARHKEEIARGEIEEINISSPEGRLIALKNQVDYVPALVVLDCHDKIIEPGV